MISTGVSAMWLVQYEQKKPSQYNATERGLLHRAFLSASGSTRAKHQIYYEERNLRSLPTRRPAPYEGAYNSSAILVSAFRRTVVIKHKRVLGIVCLTVAVACLVGCPPQTSIANINNDPGHYAGKDVTIAGHTTNSFGALGNGAFEVDDGTGRMWVISQSFGVPSNGSKVAVTGRIEQGFSFGGRSFAVIMKETKARH
jgi:hypothetical protein